MEKPLLTPTEELRAAICGSNHYNAGRAPVPCRDEAFYELVAGRPLREAAKLTEHWLLIYYRARHEYMKRTGNCAKKYEHDDRVEALGKRYTPEIPIYETD